MASEISRIDNGAVDSSAIAPPPPSTTGRLSRKGRKAAQVPEIPVDKTTHQAEYKSLGHTTLNTVAGELTQVVETTEEAIEMMVEGTAAHLANEVSNVPGRVMARINEKTGGDRTSAFFRSDATSFAADFVAALRNRDSAE